jgi:3-dehydroquinate synthase
MGVPIKQTVPVSLGERSYDILIQPDSLDKIGARLRQLVGTNKVGIVTDRNVARRFLKPIARSLKQAGFFVSPIILRPGEQTKTLRTVGVILDELAKLRFERQSVLLALGGGVVGDLTGFAAAVYQRGIPFVQVPTTLVAQVDSSVGGKTGVDHPMGKNLIGAFHQPRAVFIDPHTLRTLPQREWIAGLAEVIKYGVIADEGFFEFLDTHIDDLLSQKEPAVMHVVSRSCKIKADVVASDELESDRRRILNFGHTIGHALEAIGGYKRLIHGEAVGIGLVQEASLAMHLGLCDRVVAERIRRLVQRAGLPDRIPRTPFRSLWAAMQQDKKVVAGQVMGVWPIRIGEVVIRPLDRQDCLAWYRKQPARLH